MSGDQVGAAAPTTIPSIQDTFKRFAEAAKQNEFAGRLEVHETWGAQNRAFDMMSRLEARSASQDRMMIGTTPGYGSLSAQPGVAGMHEISGLLAKAGGIRDSFSFAKSLVPRNAVIDVSGIKASFALQEGMKDKLAGYGPAASETVVADMHGMAGSLAKAGGIRDTFSFAKSLPPQNVGADIAGIHRTFAPHERINKMLTLYASIPLQTSAFADLATARGFGSILDTGPLAELASSLAGTGPLAKLADGIAGTHKGWVVPSSILEAAGGIAGVRAATAGFGSALKGLDPLHGLSVPSSIADYLEASGSVATAGAFGSAFGDAGSLAALASGLVAGDSLAGRLPEAWSPAEALDPRSERAQPVLIVPDAAESASILEWLRNRTPTYRQAAYVCHVLAVLHAVAMIGEYETHVDPSPGVTQLELLSGAFLAILGFLLHRHGDDRRSNSQ
jgi:hypothetical protein